MPIESTRLILPLVAILFPRQTNFEHLFPAFFVVWNAKHPAWLRRLFCASAVLTSGFSRLTVGVTGLALARQVSTMTWAGVLLLVAVFAAGDYKARADKSKG
jgi:hypothetical protein